MDLGVAGIAASFIVQYLIDKYRIYIHPICSKKAARRFILSAMP
ncbi:dihydrofolate reductase family protein [Paenibacillus sp. ISL-20]|nr:dihydrofolate reductase family protein [Paenibacillus sp. ISL-20]